MKTMTKQYYQRIIDDCLETQREINEEQREVNLDRKLLGQTIKGLNQLMTSAHLILDILDKSK